jgi:hypothetical protein
MRKKPMIRLDMWKKPAKDAAEQDKIAKLYEHAKKLGVKIGGAK